MKGGYRRPGGYGFSAGMLMAMAALSQIAKVAGIKEKDIPLLARQARDRYKQHRREQHDFRTKNFDRENARRKAQLADGKLAFNHKVREGYKWA